MESPTAAGRTVVLGERELVLGFRLVGLGDAIEVTTATAAEQFGRLAYDPNVALIVASESVRQALSENVRAHADNSLRPLVVFVPAPTGAYTVESISDLAKRVLGVSLKVAA